MSFCALEDIHAAQGEGGYYEFHEVVNAIAQQYSDEACAGFSVVEGPLMGREPNPPYDHNQDYLQYIMYLNCDGPPTDYTRYWVIQSWVSELGGWDVTYHAAK